MTADKCLESFALEVLDDFATTGINADGIGILVDVGGGYTGEMGFTYPDQGVPWGLESVESFDAAKELWRAMGKSWDSVFLVANLCTQVVDCFFSPRGICILGETVETTTWAQKKSSWNCTGQLPNENP